MLSQLKRRLFAYLWNNENDKTKRTNRNHKQLSRRVLGAKRDKTISFKYAVSSRMIYKPQDIYGINILFKLVYWHQSIKNITMAIGSNVITGYWLIPCGPGVELWKATQLPFHYSLFRKQWIRMKTFFAADGDYTEEIHIFFVLYPWFWWSTYKRNPRTLGRSSIQSRSKY